MELRIWGRKRIPDIQIGTIATDAARALSLLRTLAYRYDILLAATKAAACEREDDQRLINFAEDYGLDQIDPIRRIDVLRHALSLIEEGPDG